MSMLTQSLTVSWPCKVFIDSEERNKEREKEKEKERRKGTDERSRLST